VLDIVEAIKRLESIQKSLLSYLETKRNAFPRFYFLSNEELVEILSQMKDPKSVQPHLRKCFENIAELDFGPSNEINGMISVEQEKIKFNSVSSENLKHSDFNKPIVVTGLIESWLCDVEKAMRASIHKLIARAMAEYSPDVRASWVLEWPSQVINVVSQIMWTKAVTKALHEDTTSVSQSLKQYRSILSDQIMDIVRLLRGQIPRLTRLALEALIVADVHSRDVLSELINTGVTSESDFQWMGKVTCRNAACHWYFSFGITGKTT
jgi:dynein heavy chain